MILGHELKEELKILKPLDIKQMIMLKYTINVVYRIN
jgi:hypothetical protein